MPDSGLFKPNGEVRSALFTRLIALVLATVALTQAASFLLLAVLDPIPSRTVPISVPVQALLDDDERSYRITIVPTPVEPDTVEVQAAAILEEQIANQLGLNPTDVSLDLSSSQGGRLTSLVEEVNGELVDVPALVGHFRLSVRDGQQGWLMVEPRNKMLLGSRDQRFVMLFLTLALAMMPVAFIVSRRLARPFTQLADTAERIGRDPSARLSEIDGPAEVVRTTAAFARMQRRLQLHIRERMLMLAAVAHDLKTPLTRLAFRIEALDEQQRASMAADIAEMKDLLDAAMDFARASELQESGYQLDLGSLLEQVAENLAQTGQSVSASAPQGLIVRAHPIALRRLFGNLFENGVKYGGTVSATAEREGKMIVVHFRDQGPGIAPEEMEQVFEPFYRVEVSRNRATGGVGLGLSVVRSIARGYGGDITLHNHPQGGLDAVLRLPAVQTGHG